MLMEKVPAFAGRGGARLAYQALTQRKCSLFQVGSKDQVGVLVPLTRAMQKLIGDLESKGDLVIPMLLDPRGCNLPQRRLRLYLVARLRQPGTPDHALFTMAQDMVQRSMLPTMLPLEDLLLSRHSGDFLFWGRACLLFQDRLTE